MRGDHRPTHEEDFWVTGARVSRALSLPPPVSVKSSLSEFRHPVGQDRFINVRKLAAFDLYFRRSRFVLLEFGFAVFGLGGLGVLVLLLGLARSFAAVAIGVYLVLLAIDYVPLLGYGIAISRRASSKEELRAELTNEEYFRRKYGVQQTLLMVPLVIPLLALVQELRDKTRSRTSNAS